MPNLLSSHPSRSALFEYAKDLESDPGQVSAAVAGHVAECRFCERDVDTIRSTIAVSGKSEGLEPSRKFSAALLLAVRQERGFERRGPSGYDWRSRRKTVGYAVAIVLVASLSIVAVQYGGIEIIFQTDANGPATSSASVFSLDVLSQATPAEALLGPAVLADWLPKSAWEAAQRRAVQGWDAEIEEALEALRANPACVRAATLVNGNRELRAETLKVLYVERSH